MNKRMGTRRFQVCSVILIMVSLLGTCLLCGCGKEEAQQPADTKEEAAVEGAVEESEEVVESQTEEEPVQEEVTAEAETEVEESTEEVESSETLELSQLETWVNGLGLEVPTILIWNESEATGTIVENKGEYEFGEDDRLLLYAPVIVQSITHNASYELKIGDLIFSNCVELHVNFIDKNVCMLEEESNDTIYKQEFTLVKPE